MVLLMWGWVHQRIPFTFRPSVWKKRYLVLTTMSIHMHKSEKGVISSLFPDNLPTSQVWSNFRSVKSYTSRRSKSAHTFLIEPRDPKLYPLKFKCVTLEEKEKWLDAISEQLSLTSKIWSHNILTISSTSNNNKSSPTKHVFENKSGISVSVLDKWLDRLQMTEQQQRLKDAAQPNSSSGIHFLHSSR